MTSTPQASATCRWTGNLALAGASGFVLIVCALHFLQPGYGPAHQLMSELALGPHGWAMLPAFLLLAGAMLCLAIGIARRHRSTWLQVTLVVAAATFAGAGLFPLDRAIELHIVLIAIAFVAVVLAMVLLPSLAPAEFGGKSGYASWSLAALTALGATLGHADVPIGIAQRLAAGAVIAWVCLVATKLRAAH